jgi:hypothetical protein
MRFWLCSAVMLVVACNSIVGNDPPTLRADAVAEEPDGGLPPTSTCSGDEKACFGTCVPKFSSGFSCASATSCEPCPAVLHATPTCDGPVCSSTCKKGYENCDDTPDCETDLSNPKSCGQCKADCGTKYCSPNSDGSFGCTSECAPPLKPCGQQCVDTQENPANCGGCGINCPEPSHSTATCNLGACGFECEQGSHPCNGQCVSDTDPNACGGSCIKCGSAPQNSSIACSNGACVTTCQRGWADCDGRTDNGCEINTDIDPNHCGSCKNVCTGAVAQSGALLAGQSGSGTGPTPIGTVACVKGQCSLSGVTQ